MKEKYIADLSPNDDVTEFYLLRESSIRTGSNNKQYLDLLISDRTGELRGKKWDVSDEEAAELATLGNGTIVKIRGLISEWNGAKQIKVQKIRALSENDQIDKSDFFKTAPEDTGDMFNFMIQKAESIKDQDLSLLVKKILTDNKEKFLYYPAAAKNHHAEFGGLLYHIKRMLINAEKMCEVYDILNRDLLVTGVILHDMEKLNEMDSSKDGIVSEYTFEGMMLGHLVQGSVAIGRLCDELNVPYEKKIMLEHMMISHHYEPEWGSPRKPLFPEAEILHYLDMIDAKMYDFEDALSGVKPGEFSEKVWTLDNRKIYKRGW